MVQQWSFKDNRSYPGDIEKDNFPRDNLTFPDNVLFYMSHLQQLGLAVLTDHRQGPLYVESVQSGVRIFYRYQLT